MTKNRKGRSGGDRPTPKTTDTSNHTASARHAERFASIGKLSRITRRQKRGWRKGGAR